MPPLPLSIAIVCMNNEGTLPRVLDSIAGLATEVIALDSGSTDRTLDLLTSRGVTVVHQPWLGFVKQKQAALDRCTQPWALHLDSDESIEPSLATSIRAAITRDDPTIAGYEVNRKVWYAGAFLEHAWQPEWRLRLVRRGAARWSGYDPHDAMELISNGASERARNASDGSSASSSSHAPTRLARLEGDLRHDSMDEGVARFLEKQAKHAATAAASLHARGRRGSLSRLVFSPLGEFTKQIVARGAWRDGWRGWVAASASSAAVAMKHAALIERSFTTKNTENTAEKTG